MRDHDAMSIGVDDLAMRKRMCGRYFRVETSKEFYFGDAAIKGPEPFGTFVMPFGIKSRR